MVKFNPSFELEENTSVEKSANLKQPRTTCISTSQLQPINIGLATNLNGNIWEPCNFKYVDGYCDLYPTCNGIATLSVRHTGMEF